MSAVTVVYECKTCHARTPNLMGNAGESVAAALLAYGPDVLRHLPIAHPEVTEYDRHEFRVVDTPSKGLFAPPRREVTGEDAERVQALVSRSYRCPLCNEPGHTSMTCPSVEHPEGKRYRTKSGTILTDVDLERLADEAEAGYCTAIVETKDDHGREMWRSRCFKPMPCPDHGGPDAERWTP